MYAEELSGLDGAIAVDTDVEDSKDTEVVGHDLAIAVDTDVEDSKDTEVVGHDLLTGQDKAIAFGGGIFSSSDIVTSVMGLFLRFDWRERQRLHFHSRG